MLSVETIIKRLPSNHKEAIPHLGKVIPCVNYWGLAKACGLSINSVRHYVKVGKYPLPNIKVGNRHLFTEHLAKSLGIIYRKYGKIPNPKDRKGIWNEIAICFKQEIEYLNS